MKFNYDNFLKNSLGFWCVQVKIVPRLNSNVQLSTVDPQNGSTGKSIEVTHLPEVTLYVKYPPDYPSKNPPTFHISSCWLDPSLSQLINDRLLQNFTPDYPVVYEWILFLQDELVEMYSQQQKQKVNEGQSSEERNKDGAKVESTQQDPCRIFLRSSSLLNDVEEFDSYQKHREFQESEYECGICCLTLLGSALCRPCEMCGLLYCKDCLKGYCQVRHV